MHSLGQLAASESQKVDVAEVVTQWTDHGQSWEAGIAAGVLTFVGALMLISALPGRSDDGLWALSWAFVTALPFVAIVSAFWDIPTTVVTMMWTHVLIGLVSVALDLISKHRAKKHRADQPRTE